MHNTVIIGGGNGASKSIMALKPFLSEFSLSAVIPMSDSGGSSGILRKEMNTLPPGDILRAILAMSPYSGDLLRDIFYSNRFSEVGKLSQHNVGNLFLTLAGQFGGNMEYAITALHQAVKAVGTVYPVTTQISDFCVELSNGDIVIGEHEIDKPTYNRSLRISRAWLQPTPLLHGGARQAIESADSIVIGPGSLYTSNIAALCVEGMMDALRSSSAKFIFVAGDAYQKDGETGPTKLSEMILELENFLPRPLDTIIVGNDKLSDRQLAGYDKKGWVPFVDDVSPEQDKRIVNALIQREDGFGIDPNKLGLTMRENLLK